jgi:hypothetical protein
MLDEFINMPTCNLSKIIHNKMLQQFVNQQHDFYDATCDDLVQIVM